MSNPHPYRTLFAAEDLSNTTQEIKARILSAIDNLSAEELAFEDDEIITKLLDRHLISTPTVDWENRSYSDPFVTKEEVMQFNRRVFREKQAINVKWGIAGRTDFFNKSASTSYAGGVSHRCYISKVDGTMELSIVADTLTGEVVKGAIASFTTSIEENLTWAENDLSKLASSVRSAAPSRIAKRRATTKSFEALKEELEGL